jgi:hypothetical protein
MFAVPVPQMALALAGFPVGLDVDVVALLCPDLLQQETAAEVGGQLGQEEGAVPLIEEDARPERRCQEYLAACEAGAVE